MDALLAQRDAFRENDPEKLWHTFTKRQREWYMRERMLMLVEAGGGDLVMAWYCDMTKMKDQQGPHIARNTEIYSKLPPVDEDDETRTSPGHEALERAKRERERLGDGVIVSMIYDQQAYFSAVVKRENLRLRQQQTRDPDLDYAELKDVTINGDRATGVMDNGRYQYNAHFAREDGSWKIDIENVDEHIAEWRKDQLESYESRKKAAAERKQAEEKKKSPVQDEDKQLARWAT